MTYCLSINVERGLVFCSDSRTNAGMDSIGTYSKMHTFAWGGERVFVLLSAGNLATTQAVVKKMYRDVEQALVPNLITATSMSEAADYIGMISTQLQRQQAELTRRLLDRNRHQAVGIEHGAGRLRAGGSRRIRHALVLVVGALH
ncbi:MAG: hypothetical protein LOY00_08690, partial [Methylocaldum sp.]|nr:hypothetical protein [Methylocaldum sp.]